MSYDIDNNLRLTLKKLVDCIRNARNITDDDVCQQIFIDHSNELDKLPPSAKMELLKVLPIGIVPQVCSSESYSDVCRLDEVWKDQIYNDFGMILNNNIPGDNYRIYKDIHALKQQYIRVYKGMKPVKGWGVADFDISKLLGEGAYGKVYLARAKEHFQEPVVIKIINKQRLSDKSDDGEEILKQEINNQSSIKNPHVAEIYATFEDDDNYYIVMEYCSKGDVMDQMMLLTKSKKYYPFRLVKEFMRQMTKALIATHAKGITHRDIKLENILDCGNGDYKLTDYGLSSNKPVMYKPAGTMSYASPELLYGEGYDNRTDIWSLGVAFYVLLYSSFPFDGSNNKETSKNIMNGVYKPDYNRTVAQTGVSLLNGMLDPNPVTRITLKGILAHPYLKIIKIDPKFQKKLKVTSRKRKDLVVRKKAPLPEWMTPPRELNTPPVDSDGNMVLPEFMTPPKKKKVKKKLF